VATANGHRFHSPARIRHTQRRFHSVHLMSGAAQAGDLRERRRQPRQTIEVCVVFDAVEITKGCEREIEVEKNFVDAVFGVEKIESFVATRD
jgi:hypothetical protein